VAKACRAEQIGEGGIDYLRCRTYWGRGNRLLEIEARYQISYPSFFNLILINLIEFHQALSNFKNLD
jgi:hypothetical protein